LLANLAEAHPFDITAELECRMAWSAAIPIADDVWGSMGIASSTHPTKKFAGDGGRVRFASSSLLQVESGAQP